MLKACVSFSLYFEMVKNSSSLSIRQSRVGISKGKSMVVLLDLSTADDQKIVTQGVTLYYIEPWKIKMEPTMERTDSLDSVTTLHATSLTTVHQDKIETQKTLAEFDPLIPTDWMISFASPAPQRSKSPIVEDVTPKATKSLPETPMNQKNALSLLDTLNDVSTPLVMRKEGTDNVSLYLNIHKETWTK
jgi:hypothetical protein